MSNKLNELTKRLPQSVTHRAALKKFGVGFAGMALACWLTLPTQASTAVLGPLIELSRPNAVGNCDDGFLTLPATSITLDDAFESFVAVNPINPRNIVARGSKVCSKMSSRLFRWTAAGPGNKYQYLLRFAPVGRCEARVISGSALRPTETRT